MRARNVKRSDVFGLSKVEFATPRSCSLSDRSALERKVRKARCLSGFSEKG